MPFAHNGDLTIHYRITGDGPPLILHHGLSDNLEFWDQAGYVERLRRRLTLVMFDARGHGASAKPRDPERYRLADLASDVGAVLDALGIAQAHYYGYSFGGWVGFGLAAQAPARVRSLLLGGSHPFAESMAPFRALFAAGLERWLAALEDQAGRPLPAVRARSSANDITALRALLANDRAENAAALRAITMPCTLFAGDADPRRAAVERTAQQIPHAAYIPFAGANHIQVYLDAGRVMEMIERHVATAEQAARPVVAVDPAVAG